MIAATSVSPPWGERSRAGLDPLSWSALIIFAGHCLALAWSGAFPVPFDELAHFSYAWHITQTGEILPSLADLRLVDPAAPAHWSETPNYLNHPSPYYVLLASLAAPFAPSPADLVLPWRLLNCALAAGAVAAVLRLGQEADWSTPAHAAFVVLIAFNPTLPVLGGIVTNDNLALLGGALCCLGTFRLLSGERDRAVWITVGSGLLIAALAKLTAALLCGLLLGAALAWLVAGEGFAVLRRPPAVFCLTLGGLGLLPYLLFILNYGSPAPFTDGQAVMIASRLADLPQWQAQRLDFPSYVSHFVRSLVVYWPPVTPASRSEIALLALPATCLAVALIGVLGALLATGRRSDDVIARFVIAGAGAMAVVAVIHLGFTFALHRETGWLRGVYPRYYFPLLAVLPAACAWLIERCRRRWCRWALAGGLIAATLGYDLLIRSFGSE